MWQKTAAALIFPLLLGISTGPAKCSEPPTFKRLLEQKCDERDRRLSDPCDAVKYFAAFHREPQLGPEFKYKFSDGSEGYLHTPNRILVISWFRQDGTQALRYTVNDSGRVHDVRDVHRWALQASHDHQLAEDGLKHLRRLLPRLPHSTADPPINRTVYVSFVENSGWRTETYDADSLPDEFESVMHLLGERFETRDRK